MSVTSCACRCVYGDCGTRRDCRGCQSREEGYRWYVVCIAGMSVAWPSRVLQCCRCRTEMTGPPIQRAIAPALYVRPAPHPLSVVLTPLFCSFMHFPLQSGPRSGRHGTKSRRWIPAGSPNRTQCKQRFLEHGLGTPWERQSLPHQQNPLRSEDCAEKRRTSTLVRGDKKRLALCFPTPPQVSAPAHQAAEICGYRSGEAPPEETPCNGTGTASCGYKGRVDAG